MTYVHDKPLTKKQQKVIDRMIAVFGEESMAHTLKVSYPKADLHNLSNRQAQKLISLRAFTLPEYNRDISVHKPHKYM